VSCPTAIGAIPPCAGRNWRTKWRLPPEKRQRTNRPPTPSLPAEIEAELDDEEAADLADFNEALAQERRRFERQRRPLTDDEAADLAHDMLDAHAAGGHVRGGPGLDLAAMPERWRAFFVLLTQSGERVGELLGLTWRHVYLGDDPHSVIAEQVYARERKKLNTDASLARVPLSGSMATWLGRLRPEGVDPDAPVFPSAVGTPLNYHNVYNRVLRPALRESGIAVKLSDEPERWDYQGVAFHAFRKACGSLLFAAGRNAKQVQGLAAPLAVDHHHERLRARGR
jgi:integrase